MKEIHSTLPWVLDATPAHCPCDFIIRYEASHPRWLSPTLPEVARAGTLADGQFIVRACNAHYHLVSALKLFLAQYDGPDADRRTRPEIQAARYALNLAEVQS